MLLATALTMTGSWHDEHRGYSAHGHALTREAGSVFDGNQPGSVVLVTRGNEVLLRQASGMADVENRVATQPRAGDHRLCVLQSHQPRRQRARQQKRGVHGHIDADSHQRAADDQHAQPAPL
ncbi:hypothetical protein FHY16_002625 [Xanthomonas campestris]|uniref:hypothetical protein n=1 Tax=Xanthomonas euroxanthea TaxID=2259622 RepID=UPI00161E026A|nr:hypothetical protein [Xanthomonas euroxanthea]MBB3779855.1 hypothetical protein [Xanthomonas euroxanthea]